MGIYEIPNIQHCRVEEIGNPVVGYRVTANDGWYIHANDGDEDTANIYKKAVFLRYDYPFEQIEIIAEADLPVDAEILGTIGTETVTE